MKIWVASILLVLGIAKKSYLNFEHSLLIKVHHIKKLLSLVTNVRRETLNEPFYTYLKKE